MGLHLFPGTQIDLIFPNQVQAGQRVRLLGREVLYFPRTDSTNRIAQDHAQCGAEEGLVVLTEEQLAGRGRRGRRWEAPFGSSLLVSVLLRPTFLPPEQAFLLTVLTCLAIDRGVFRETGLQPQIKWPNDLLLDGRKVCGILVELKGRPAQIEWAVLGWGLNVNVDFSRDELLCEQATSLAMELGTPLARLPLLWTCLEEIETHYAALRAGKDEELWSTWRGRLETLGRPVEVIAPGETFTGYALDVDTDGALLVRRQDGSVERVLAGDVSVR